MVSFEAAAENTERWSWGVVASVQRRLHANQTWVNNSWKISIKFNYNCNYF